MPSDLPAGRALDERVAERAMCWDGFFTLDDRLLGFAPGADNAHDVPPYSTDIAAAWQVVEKMAAPTWWVDLYRKNADEWECALYAKNGRAIVKRASTAPHAICLAALAAVEAEGAARAGGAEGAGNA